MSEMNKPKEVKDTLKNLLLGGAILGALLGSVYLITKHPWWPLIILGVVSAYVVGGVARGTFGRWE